ncbi:MAG TPA: hypothetical protein VKP01_04435, partial [Saliniramus sp.]|nr:hypothetical protein [Saliniramus sp.]
MKQKQIIPGRSLAQPDRRRLLTAGLAVPTGLVAAAGSLAVGAGAAQAGPGASPMLRDAREFGIRPDSEADQAPLLEAALRETTQAGGGLQLPPGRYRVAEA